LVVLHGWGAKAQDLVPFASLLQLPEYQFLFPNAPFPHYQAPGGRAWYALEKQDYEGITESRQQLRDWMLSLEERTGVPLSQTMMAGFSQGGAMTLDIGTSLPLMGLCSLSGYLHGIRELQSPIPPILLVHGRQDRVVPLSLAQKARNELEQLGATVEYHEFEMGHEVSPVVLGLMQQFIRSHDTE
jgi:phospholipase/carboxylesterase